MATTHPSEGTWPIPVLQIAVTGGIGSGKSTVAKVLGERGALVIDADQLARDVVAPGTPGLAAVRERFGEGIIVDGGLDRPALGRVVFQDADARRDLEHIVHPLVRAAAAELASTAGPGDVVVNDYPLLVRLDQAAASHLVIAATVQIEERIRRLVIRGHTEADAKARIAAQITDAERAVVTDVWLDNNQDASTLRAEVEGLWVDRIQPMVENLTSSRAAPRRNYRPRQAELMRAKARVQRALGDIPIHTPAEVDLEVNQADLASIRESEGDHGLAARLAAVGFFRITTPDQAGSLSAGDYGYLDPEQPIQLRCR